MKFRWEAPTGKPQSAFIDGAWGRFLVRRTRPRSSVWELVHNGKRVDTFYSKDKAMGHAEALAIAALNDKARELVRKRDPDVGFGPAFDRLSAPAQLQTMLTERAAARVPELTIHILSDDMKPLQSFRVPVEGGWPLHKVAEEIRSNIENAYRVKEPS